jgi:hypothetical protein
MLAEAVFGLLDMAGAAAGAVLGWRIAARMGWWR